LHSVTTLAPKAAYEECPFDETLTGWEDWEIYIRLASKGWCGIHIPEPLLAYRLEAGSRRESSLVDKDKLVGEIKRRYGEYIEGGKKMGCSSCGRRQQANVAAAVTPNQSAGNGKGDLVLVEYVTANIAMHEVVGGATGQKYGRKRGGSKFYMYDRDQAAKPHLFRLV
jgi:hypothetical protein